MAAPGPGQNAGPGEGENHEHPGMLQVDQQAAEHAKEGEMPTYTKREWLILRVGVFGKGDAGVVSGLAALWG